MHTFWLPFGAVTVPPKPWFGPAVGTAVCAAAFGRFDGSAVHCEPMLTATVTAVLGSDGQTAQPAMVTLFVEAVTEVRAPATGGAALTVTVRHPRLTAPEGPAAHTQKLWVPAPTGKNPL